MSTCKTFFAGISENVSEILYGYLKMYINILMNTKIDMNFKQKIKLNK